MIFFSAAYGEIDSSYSREVRVPERLRWRCNSCSKVRFSPNSGHYCDPTPPSSRVPATDGGGQHPLQQPAQRPRPGRSRAVARHVLPRLQAERVTLAMAGGELGDVAPGATLILQHRVELPLRLRQVPSSITPSHRRLSTWVIVLWCYGLMVGFKAGSLPVPSVKIFRLQHREINIIDAARVDVDLVRIRAWHIERMDAAVLAERMLGHASVKRVGR
jgi:hypothetical protein